MVWKGSNPFISIIFFYNIYFYWLLFFPMMLCCREKTMTIKMVWGYNIVYPSTRCEHVGIVIIDYKFKFIIIITTPAVHRPSNVQSE